MEQKSTSAEIIRHAYEDVYQAVVHGRYPKWIREADDELFSKSTPKFKKEWIIADIDHMLRIALKDSDINWAKNPLERYCGLLHEIHHGTSVGGAQVNSYPITAEALHGMVKTIHEQHPPFDQLDTMLWVHLGDAYAENPANQTAEQKELKSLLQEIWQADQIALENSSVLVKPNPAEQFRKEHSRTAKRSSDPGLGQ